MDFLLFAGLLVARRQDVSDGAMHNVVAMGDNGCLITRAHGVHRNRLGQDLVAAIAS